jgi:hypothetical protein
MASKVKINETMIDLDAERVTVKSNSEKTDSILDIANNYLKVKQAEGIPVTEAFRKLFILNYIESKNLELSWRKTRGN